MTLETYMEACEKVKAIKQYDAKIKSFTGIMEIQVEKESAYNDDEILMEIYNGRDKTNTCYVPRYLVKDMLKACVCLYQKKKEEAERGLASI